MQVLKLSGRIVVITSFYVIFVYQLEGTNFHLKCIYFIVQIKYYKYKGVLSIISFKILIVLHFK